MTCDEVKAMLAGYADGELTLPEREAVEAHLCSCGRCRQIVHDQQRVQHVLGAYDIPPVGENRWNAIGKVLRAELVGKGERAVPKTRPWTESLGEPPTLAPATAQEKGPAPTVPAEVPPTGRLLPAPAVPALKVHTVEGRKRRVRFWWVAHVAGAVAAAVLVAVGLAALLLPGGPPIEPGMLARQRDVQIHKIEVLDPDYSVIYRAGDPDDLAIIWVVPGADES